MGLSALDLACGEGFYTRVIRHCGAARVRGLDLPEAIISASPTRWLMPGSCPMRST